MEKDPSKGGLGYPAFFREKVVRFAENFDAEKKGEQMQAAADTFGASIASIYRWAARERDSGSFAKLPHAGGVQRVLSGEGDVLLMLYMSKLSILLFSLPFRCFCVIFVCWIVAWPNAIHSQYAAWLSSALQQNVSETMVDDAMQKLRITHKHIHKIAAEQDPVRCVPLCVCRSCCVCALLSVSLVRRVLTLALCAAICCLNRASHRLASKGCHCPRWSTWTSPSRFWRTATATPATSSWATRPKSCPHTSKALNGLSCSRCRPKASSITGFTERTRLARFAFVVCRSLLCCSHCVAAAVL